MVPEESIPDAPPDDGWPSADLSALERESDEDLPAAEVSTDDLFQALSSARNRYVLTYLLRASRPVPLYELADYVMSHVDPPAAFTPAEFRGRISTELFHSTCPKLDEVGLVAFDEKSQIVRETNKTVLALPHLRLALQRAELADDE